MPNYPNPSGLYNILCGRNPNAQHILGAAGLFKSNQEEFPLGRYRDATLNEDATEAHLFTRNGKLVKITAALEKHPNFNRLIHIESDAYVTYVFNIPQYYDPSDESCERYNLPKGTRVDQWQKLRSRLLPDSCYVPYERLKIALEKIQKNEKISDEVDIYNREIINATQEVANTGIKRIVATSQGASIVLPFGKNGDEYQIGFFDIDTTDESLFG